MSRICVEDTCEKPRMGKYRHCAMHRARIRRHGTTDGGERNHGTLAVRYQRFVIRTDSGCWSWAGATNERGYAKLGRAFGHRVSWEVHHGPIPDGLWVLHRCDNPPCTNPEHLFLGTHADNMADATSKGRLNGRPNRPTGEANKASKLTVVKVREIHRLRAAGWTQRRVAAHFGVSQSLIGQIATGRLWRSA